MKTVVLNRLRELRQEHGLTQEQLAHDLDVTRHTILALEVGRYVPSIELALRLAAYFDLPLERIFWLDPVLDAEVRGLAPQPIADPETGQTGQPESDENPAQGGNAGSAGNAANDALSSTGRARISREDIR